jgi:hypothetical protein
MLERHAMADVIEHLVEVERRRLYLAHAASSLYRYCIDRLGYAQDAALKRHRVARLALRLPQVLGELRVGTIHLTGLFLLSTHLTADNAGTLLAEARGKSRRQLEELIASWFPRPDVAPSLALVATRGDTTCSGAGIAEGRARLEPLSPDRVRVEFTARAEFYDKLQQARQLLSHALPSGDLGELMERALDALLEKETRQRFGVGGPRKQRKLRAGSRHVPVEVQRAVWQRDGAQCTFVDAEGRRCGERSFLTLEHRQPFALGGPPTTDNLCVLCRAHNLASARDVFGDEQIEASIRAGGGPPVVMQAGAVKEPWPGGSAASCTPASLGSASRVLSALCQLGFRRADAAAAIGSVLGSAPSLQFEQLLRQSLPLLVPARG